MSRRRTLRGGLRCCAISIRPAQYASGILGEDPNGILNNLCRSSA